MAEPQKKPTPTTGVVGECAATDCSHNESQECHADEILVQIDGQQAVCGTYDPTSPKARP